MYGAGPDNGMESADRQEHPGTSNDPVPVLAAFGDREEVRGVVVRVSDGREGRAGLTSRWNTARSLRPGPSRSPAGRARARRLTPRTGRSGTAARFGRRGPGLG